MVEESKEADRTTGQASHRLSRGLHDKVIVLFWVLDVRISQKQD